MSGSSFETATRLDRKNDVAAAEVSYRFADHLVRLTWQRLNARFWQKADAGDIIPSAFSLCLQCGGTAGEQLLARSPVDVQDES